MNTNISQAQVLQFPLSDKLKKVKDATRIYLMYELGEITRKECEQWLKNGGHI